MPDHLTQSRLELRLQEEIARAANPLDADCKRAELAAYHSRLGRTDEARSTLTLLHQRYDGRPHVAISAWVNLVEGLLGYFDNTDPASRDKLLRAYALSSAASLTATRALSAAWLAQLDYLRPDPASMAQYLNIALSTADAEHHSARSRASLVLAQAHHFSGHFDVALRWYSSARTHAVADGDEATVSALMHNMAWLRGHELRQRYFQQLQSSDVTSHALLAAESAGSFDSLIGASSLQSLVPILRAQILAVQGREAEALAIFTDHLTCASKDGMTRLQPDMLANMAWCRLIAGDAIGAASDAETAETSLDPKGQLDDRAFAHSRLTQVFEKLGNHARSDAHQVLAAEAWAGYRKLQQKFAATLEVITAHPRVA